MTVSSFRQKSESILFKRLWTPIAVYTVFETGYEQDIIIALIENEINKKEINSLLICVELKNYDLVMAK